MLPENIAPLIEKELGTLKGQAVNIVSYRPVAGGCINNGGKLQTTKGAYFLKWNDAARGDMFQAERHGLELLRSHSPLHIPKPYAHGGDATHIFLLMEHVQAAHKQKMYWEILGQGLARQHRHTAEAYGLERDNYIGSLPQYNSRRSSFTDFFAEMRIEKQLEIAAAKGLDVAGVRAPLQKLMARLDSLLPEEAPALLHGDLWSGNLLTGLAGQPVLIDPAVHYGHREAELAFTRLFGGFDERMYQAYNEEWLLEPGFEERKDIYNLYPLLVHWNLFGDAYLHTIRSILKRY